MSKPSEIADHQHALSVYLNDMLHENKVDDAHQSPPINDNWRASSFKALLFDVQGLQIAIPSHQLSAILTLEKDKLSPSKQKSNWFLGGYKQDQKTIQLVETSRIILPTDYQSKISSTNFIITITGQKWGLSCDKVNKVISISPDEVKWRQQSASRMWLAGTALKKNCSILNIEALVKQLEHEYVNV
mgnify:CR=1 FL=1